MKYINSEFNVLETPVEANVNGYIIVLTDAQLRTMGYKPYDEIVYEQDEELQTITPTKETLERYVLDNIVIQEPPEMVFKLGYKWKPTFNGNTVTFEWVYDENAVGLSHNPILFADGVRLIPNAYYFHEGELYVYVGSKDYGKTWDEVKDLMEKMDV